MKLKLDCMSIGNNLKQKYGLFGSIQEQYQFIKSNPRDQLGKDSIHWIAPYMDVLKFYADRSSVVVEFGVNQVNSTWAFLNSKCKEVHSVDIDFDIKPVQHHQELTSNIWLNHARYLADKEGKEFKTYECSSLDVDFDVIDFLFIDSLHTDGHLAKELSKHGSKVNNFIAFHDTNLFASQLLPPIKEFMELNPGWKIDYMDNCHCGMIVIKKDKI